MSVGNRSGTTTYAPTIRVFAAGADRDLLAASPDYDSAKPGSGSCPRSVMPLASGTFTKLVDADGIDNPIATALAAGLEIRGDFKTANCSAVFIAFYGRPTNSRD